MKSNILIQINPIQKVVHKLQENGFGILQFTFNHLDNHHSIVSIIPLISIIKQMMVVIISNSNIIN